MHAVNVGDAKPLDKAPAWAMALHKELQQNLSEQVNRCLDGANKHGNT